MDVYRSLQQAVAGGRDACRKPSVRSARAPRSGPPAANRPWRAPQTGPVRRVTRACVRARAV